MRARVCERVNVCVRARVCVRVCMCARAHANTEVASPSRRR